MITNFNSKTFVFKNISQWFIFFLVYIVLSGNPLLTVNSVGMDLIPQINVRELLCIAMGKTLSLAYFSTSITFLCVSVINVFWEKYALFSNTCFSCEKRENCIKKFFGDFLILDFSNPFLLSCKTKGLRE